MRVALAALVGLGLIAAAPVAAPVPAPAPAVLTVTGEAGRTARFTAADLAALPRESVAATAGHEGPTHAYEGARLTDLLRAVGAPMGARVHGRPVTDLVVATGADGYRAVFSLVEADPGSHTPSKIIVADRVDGHALDAKEGPWRLVVEGDARPIRSVHNLASIALQRLP